MPYQYDLGPSQKIYLDNPSPKTLITLASGGLGQQQQSSTQVQTGEWTEVPQVAIVGGGVLIRCVTGRGAFVWQVQGMQIGAAEATRWPAAQAVPMQFVEAGLPMAPMQPMPPMQPMKMGDMEMSASPMTMRMGNMELSMGNAPNSSAGVAKFCTECGTAVGPSDRFCSSCGHSLQ